MKSRPFAQTAILSILGRAGGLLIPFLIAAFYGATLQTDAFFLAYGLAIAFTTLFSQMFESAIIPYLAVSQGVMTRTVWFIKTALFKSLPYFVGAGLILAWSLQPLLSRLGWSPEGAAMVSRIMMGLQPFLWFGLGTSAWHGLFYHQRLFWFPAVSPLIRSVLVAGFILGLHKVIGIHALTAGLACGELLRFLTASKLGGPMVVSADCLKQESADPILLRKFFGDAFWQMAALLAIHLMVVTDQCFAQTAGIGQLTLLSYADRLIQIPYLVFLAGFLNIFHADWSRLAVHHPSDFYRKLRRDLLWVALGSALTALMVILAAPSAVVLFYGRAPLSEPDRHVLLGLFTWYAVGLIPGVLRLALGRVLIVLRASRFYFVQAWLELGLNIILNVVFMRFFGVVGIAMATALAYTLSSLWLYLYLVIREKRGSAAAV